MGQAMTAIRVIGILSLCALVTVESICHADTPPTPDPQPSNRAAAVDIRKRQQHDCKESLSRVRPSCHQAMSRLAHSSR